jgi:hypothetical protein
MQWVTEPRAVQRILQRRTAGIERGANRALRRLDDAVQ